MTETISTKQLAAVLGISVQRVNELGRKGKIHREPDGGWDLVKVNADLRQNLNKSQTIRSLGQSQQRGISDPGNGNGDNGATFAEAQRRHEWAKVQKEEMELRRRRGELLESKDVSKTWCSITTSVQTRMMMVPAKVAPKISDGMSVQERSAIIEHAIREALTALSEYEPNAA